jgi:hypothetical protein
MSVATGLLTAPAARALQRLFLPLAPGYVGKHHGVADRPASASGRNRLKATGGRSSLFNDKERFNSPEDRLMCTEYALQVLPVVLA